MTSGHTKYLSNINYYQLHFNTSKHIISKNTFAVLYTFFQKSFTGISLFRGFFIILHRQTPDTQGITLN